MNDARFRSVLYVGLCLPEIATLAFTHLGGAPLWVSGPARSPVGLLPICFALAMLFEEIWRKRAFMALLSGSWLHITIDLCLDTTGAEAPMWAFPVMMNRMELEVIAPPMIFGPLFPAFVLMAAIELAYRAARGLKRAPTATVD